MPLPNPKPNTTTTREQTTMTRYYDHRHIIKAGQDEVHNRDLFSTPTAVSEIPPRVIAAYHRFRREGYGKKTAAGMANCAAA